MSNAYVDFPIVIDPDQLSADALDYLVANLPGFVPHEGNLEVILVEALARMVSEAAGVASSVPRSIFRYFGRTLINLPPIDAAPATTQSTWTVVDNAGYTIPQGTVVGFQVTGDTLIAFTVDSDVVIAPGTNTTAAGAVHLTATVDGSIANDIPVGAMVLVDALQYVTAINSTLITSGGVDAESDDTYLNRLAQELALLSPEPILPLDFAILARRVAGVFRAVAIDGYNPADATYSNQRMITLAMVDTNGNAVSSAIKTNVVTYLEALREVNFVVNTIDPTYTAVNVNFTGTLKPGFLAADVTAAAIAAVTAYLNPSTWGGGGDQPPQWILDTKVRYLEIATVLNNVAGLDHVTLLTINGVAGDLTLAGVAPLPTVGAITGAVA